MGLFSKKEPCPVCGGKPAFMLPTKVEGKALCSDCAGKIDMDVNIKKQLSISELKNYMSFYEENQHLKDMFNISETIDFGFMDTKILFDFNNKLFCLSKKLDKTVFEGSQIVSFCISEDHNMVFEGNSDGINQYPSVVPEKLHMIAPMIERYAHEKRREKHDNDDNKRHDHFDIPEPFKAFILNINVDHPYWNELIADMDGPRFNNNDPSVRDYDRDYMRDCDTIQALVNAFEKIMF